MKDVTMHKNFDTPPAATSLGWCSLTKLLAVRTVAALVTLQLISCAPAIKPQTTPAPPDTACPTCTETTQNNQHQPQKESTADNVSGISKNSVSEKEETLSTPQSSAPTSSTKDQALNLPESKTSPALAGGASNAATAPEALTPDEAGKSTRTNTSEEGSIPASIHTAVTALEQNTYTVKPGENLYTIARLANIYGDGMLWPLIYRANRDQIKDPRQIYPGQKLNVPRDITRSEQDNARKSALENPIFNTTQNE